MAASLSVYIPLVALAVGASGAAALVIARQLAAPTAKLLLGVCALLLTTVLAQAIVLIPSPLRRAVRTATGVSLPGEYGLVVVFVLTLPTCALWLLFAIRHTGRGDRLRRQITVLLTGVVALCYGVAVTAGRFDIIGPGVGAALNSLASSLFLVSPFASLGAVLIVETALRRNALPLGEAALLAGSSLSFIYGPIVAFNLDQPLAVPASVCGAAGLLAIAVRRYPVFETLPIARIAARDRLVEEMDDAVLLVDEQTRVVDLNAAAESLFGVDAEAVDRRRLGDVVPSLPGLSTLATASGPVAVQRGRTSLEVRANRVRDERRIPVGYLVVCRDVTERRRRERRLRLLTQFLTETVGERTATVATRARALAGGGSHAGECESSPERGPSAGIPTAIKRTTESLARLVAATRHVERALSDRDTGSCDLRSVLRASVADRDEVTFHDAGSSDGDAGPTVPVDPAVVRAVVDLLIEEQRTRRPAGLEIRLTTPTESVSVLELDGSAPQSTDTHPVPRSPTGDTSHGERGVSTAGSAADPPIKLSQLALDHAGGRVERRGDGSLEVRFEHRSPQAGALTSTADTQRGGSDAEGRHASSGGDRDR